MRVWWLCTSHPIQTTGNKKPKTKSWGLSGRLFGDLNIFFSFFLFISQWGYRRLSYRLVPIDAVASAKSCMGSTSVGMLYMNVLCWGVHNSQEESGVDVILPGNKAIVAVHTLKRKESLANSCRTCHPDKRFFLPRFWAKGNLLRFTWRLCKHQSLCIWKLAGCTVTINQLCTSPPTQVTFAYAAALRCRKASHAGLITVRCFYALLTNLEYCTIYFPLFPDFFVSFPIHLLCGRDTIDKWDMLNSV